jgi:hypothetical protein
MKILKKWWFWVIVVIILGVIGAGGGDNEPKNKTVTTSISENGKSKPQEENKDDYIKAGMYKVGKDIPAGEYILYGNGSMAYYQVTKDSSGNFDSIISNDNFSGTRYVTVTDGQYIEFRSAKMLPVEKAPAQQPKGDRYIAGMYKVGKDIPAGEYKVIAEGMAYLEVSKDSAGNIDSIITNDNFNGEKYITIQDGQYIKLVNCYIVK